MLELVMQREGDALVTTDDAGYSALCTIGFDEFITCRITRPRNIKHHRLFFGVLQEVFKNQDYYATLDAMLDDIKIAVGHFEMVPTKFSDTGFKKRPKSINFAALDQTAFSEFYEKAITFILTEILPRTNRAELEQRVYDILGEPGPQSIDRM